MPVIQPCGTCSLCRQDKLPRASHFIPAALYPKNKKIAMATLSGVTPAPKEIMDYLLCGDCEERFNRNGESEVLRLLAPKAKNEVFPLRERVRNAPVVVTVEGMTGHDSRAIEIDAERLAYFALSVIWRGAVHSWTLPDGSKCRRCRLGRHEEPIRQFLIGQTPFPQDAAVLVSVCEDAFSRD